MQQFLSEPRLQKVKIMSEDPQSGPDGFPYIMLQTDAQGEEPFLNVVDWCVSRGIGIVLNPHKETPDTIFTYGMLWNYREKGEFFTQAPVVSGLGDMRVDGEKPLFAGHPSESYWPLDIRKIFKEFLVQQGVLNPRVLMLGEKQDGPMDLVFSLESIGNPPQKEWAGILEAFAWFFPRHYSLSLINEKTIQGLSFIGL
jgi:hypothetical protein